jgi:hypothetical protein
MTSWLSQQFGAGNYFAVSIICYHLLIFMRHATEFGNWYVPFPAGIGGGALLVTLKPSLLKVTPVEKEDGAGHYGCGVIHRPYPGRRWEGT